MQKTSLIFIFFILLSCKKEKTITEKVRTKIEYELVPEALNQYSVNWNDTLGKSEGYLPEKFLMRPKEIKCVITNDKNDTLGYYKGLSMAQSFAYFHTTDSIVNLNFMIGLNMFSDKFQGEEGKKYWESNRKIINFKPIRLSLKSSLRKKTEVELEEK